MVHPQCMRPVGETAGTVVTVGACGLSGCGSHRRASSHKIILQRVCGSGQERRRGWVRKVDARGRCIHMGEDLGAVPPYRLVSCCVSSVIVLLLNKPIHESQRGGRLHRYCLVGVLVLSYLRDSQAPIGG